MTRRTLALGVLLAIGACAGTQLLLDKGPDTATLHVEVRGIEPAGGTLRCALFGTPEGFPGEPETAERTAVLDIEGSMITWTLDDLPTGVWAVSLFHDENDDGVLATDWMGRPSEGWGVSNDARGSFGAPSFEDAAVEVVEGEQRIVIQLSY